MQCDSEEPLTSSDSEFNFFSHKRSNSCSSDDRLRANKVRDYLSTETTGLGFAMSLYRLHLPIKARLVCWWWWLYTMCS